MQGLNNIRAMTEFVFLGELILQYTVHVLFSWADQTLAWSDIQIMLTFASGEKYRALASFDIA